MVSRAVGILVPLCLVCGLEVTPARAEHGDPGYAVWPPEEGALPLNGRVMALSVNGAALEVTEIATRSPRLVGDGDTVPLRVVDKFRGHDWNGYGRSGFVLQPARALRPQTHYSLWEDNDGGTLCLGSWTTARAPDRRPPSWTRPPSQVRKASSYEYSFVLPVRDDGPLIIEAVASGQGPPQRVLFGLTASAGPDACATLILDPPPGQPPGQRRRFVLAFAALDAAGHRSASPQRFPVLVNDGDNIELCLPEAPPKAERWIPGSSE